MLSPLPRERVEGDAGVDVAGADDADVDAAVAHLGAEGVTEGLQEAFSFE